ncbi:MAG: hypothetical protein JF588_06060 [Caulobacterales bacterium]|nr:hypothetical protein [Caulobacterales bacterium]
MRSLKLALVAALAVQSLAPVAASAQPARYDRDRDSDAAEACSSAVQGEVRARFPEARDVRFYDRALRAGPSYAETIVKGRGEFDGRDGRISSFAFGCTFNGRTGATYALDVRDVRFVEAERGDNNRDRGDKDNGAAIAGAVIGAAILGAALASKDKHHDDWFSPADGVRCNRHERACYRDGRRSDYWSRRVF